MSFLTGDELPDELLPYKHRLSKRFFEVRNQVIQFVVGDILPAQRQYAEEIKNLQNRWGQPPILDELKAKAKKKGIWNLFLPSVSGLSVLEYAPIAEILGAVSLANHAMNCSAPDTGNMEVLELYGSEYQKQQWLKPLL